MKTGMIILLSVILLAVWLISVQRKLTDLDENIKNAMSQIGVQLSSRYELILALLGLLRHYDRDTKEVEKLVREKRCTVTAETEAKQASEQAAVLSEAWKYLMEAVVRYPAVEYEQNYKKYRDAAESYEKMLRTSGLIYNDAVSRYNQMVSRFPASMAAGLLGFRKKTYLERR